MLSYLGSAGPAPGPSLSPYPELVSPAAPVPAAPAAPDVPAFFSSFFSSFASWIFLAFSAASYLISSFFSGVLTTLFS